MALNDWFTRSTPLQSALKLGTEPGGNLEDELDKLDDYPIKTEADARAICSVLERFQHAESAVGGESAFHSLIGLFQNVEGRQCPAFPVMVEVGIPLLGQIVLDGLNNPARRESNELMFALKILAMYGTREGTDIVIHAASLPFESANYMWSVILNVYGKGHPQLEALLNALTDPLPSDFLAVSLMDAANTVLLEGVDVKHPFDSGPGKQMLEKWLKDPNQEYFSYAVSATASLPFIHEAARNELLAIAINHPSVDVQLEAAWVEAKQGRETGIQRLARYCLDVNKATMAMKYLTELGRADAIPSEVEEPEFQVKAEFAQWLAHPNELGRAPDELQIVDHRDWNWPPDREKKHLWLIQYRVKVETGEKSDDVGVGMVGSITFTLFSYKLELRSPEDCYAIHCYWEMSFQDMIKETEGEDVTDAHMGLLRQCKLDNLGPAKVLCVADLSPQLQYPQNQVALAQVSRNGEPGWLVLDGPRTRWYAESRTIADCPDRLVMMVHVGRVLLGIDK